MAKKQLSQFEFEDRILVSLRKRKGVATAGDVAADTGLPLEEAELAMREMLSHYKSHLDVDDDGNLLYRFDPKLKRRGDEPGRRWHQFKKKAWAAFTYFFKVWIMITLVGYTAIFLLLLLAAAVAGFAAQQSSDSDSGGGRIFMFPIYLFIRVLELFFWISLFENRSFGGGYGRGRGRGFGAQKRRKKPDVPVYQRIFNYVFGPEIKRDPLASERAFAQFVRNRRGRITAAEWSSRTGQSLQDADNALTGSVMRFRGDIDVSDTGALVYRFDDLRVTAETGTQSAIDGDLPPIWQRAVTVPPLTGNKGSTNTWVTIFNGFNLTMSAIVFSMAAELHMAAVIGLGYVPLIFSTIFFAIPIVRWLQRRRKVAAAARENERRSKLEAVYLSAQEGRARPIREEVLPEPLATRVLVDFEGDVQVSDDGETLYLFPRVAEQLQAAEQARQAAADELVFGKTVFSSDEETVSLAEADLADFDQRLARELGGDVAFDFETTPAFSSFAEVGKSH